MITKKKFEHCAQTVRLVRQIDADLEEIRASLLTSPRLTALPKGGSGHPGLDTYYCRIEDLVRVREKAYLVAEKSCDEVIRITESCRSDLARYLIRLVYIADLSLSDACKKAGVVYHTGYMIVQREMMRLDRLARESKTDQ